MGPYGIVKVNFALVMSVYCTTERRVLFVR